MRLLINIGFAIMILTGFYSNEAKGQVDSLENALSTAQGTERLEVLSELMRFYARRDREKTEELAGQFKETFKKIGEPEEYEGIIYQNDGYAMLLDGNYRDAIEQFKIAEKPYLKNNQLDLLWGLYNSWGTAHEELGEYEEALKYYLKSMKAAEDNENPGAAAGTAINMGVIYAEKGEYEKALEYFHYSASYHKSLGTGYGLGNNLNNIAEVHRRFAEFDSALYYFKEAMKVWEESNDQRGLAMTNHNMGSLYIDKEEYTRATYHLMKSLEISKEINEMYGILLNSQSLGAIALKQRKFRKAIEYYSGVIELAEPREMLPNLQVSYKAIYKSYKELGNATLALEYMEKFFEVYDSLNNAAKEKNLQELQNKYETEKKELEIENLEKGKRVAEQQTELNAAKLREEKLQSASQQRLIIFLVIGLALIAAIGLFIYRGLVQKKRANEEIKKQKEIVDIKNQEILDSIEYAKRIQNAILPPLKLVKEYLTESFILYAPKDIVAGDFYWMESYSEALEYIEKENSWVYFAAADCTGHGVPGAMVSVVCSNALSKALIEENITEPGQILDRTRELVIERFGRSEDNIKDGMDISLCALNTKTLELKWSGANNPLWIIKAGDDEVIEIKPDKQPIGQYIDPQPYTTHTIQLHAKDRLYIFSDGFADQFGGERGKKFKASNFKKLLISIKDLPMKEQHDRIQEVFEEWKGELEQLDDVCIIGLQV